MDYFDEIELQDCPCCGGVGSIEAERRDAARKAAMNWNLRKVISPGPGE